MIPNYYNKVTVPIRDMDKDGRVAFLVDVCGVTHSDLAAIGGDVGSRPLRKAVERMGLDPNRFMAILWDVRP